MRSHEPVTLPGIWQINCQSVGGKAASREPLLLLATGRVTNGFFGNKKGKARKLSLAGVPVGEADDGK